MESKISCFAMLCHPTNAAAPKMMQLALDWARKCGVKILVEKPMAEKVGLPKIGVSRRVMARECEMVLVLGGDGSILEAVRAFASHRLPITGINLGHLGFLTLGQAADTVKYLERLRLGQYHIEKRLMLSATVKREGKVIHQGLALNDVVVVKDPISRVIHIDVSISGTFISGFRGDGVIFSTPTGSTAYSLSAGGPIIPPWVEAFLLCPLASHTLGVRPVVTSDREIFLAHLTCSHSKVSLVLDGQEGFPLKDGDEIEVARAKEEALIVALQRRNFFKILQKKMKWGK